MLQQLQKLPIDEFFAKTVPEGTQDCEPSPVYNLDQVSFPGLMTIWLEILHLRTPFGLHRVNSVHCTSTLLWQKTLSNL